jgi:hypothetical protein
MIMRDVLAS